jgi:hypothetical protein
MIYESWGSSTVHNDVLIPADYNADTVTDYAVWRPTTGYWYVLESLTHNEYHLPLSWTQNGDVPIPSAYNRY